MAGAVNDIASVCRNIIGEKEIESATIPMFAEDLGFARGGGYWPESIEFEKWNIRRGRRTNIDVGAVGEGEEAEKEVAGRRSLNLEVADALDDVQEEATAHDHVQRRFQKGKKQGQEIAAHEIDEKMRKLCGVEAAALYRLQSKCNRKLHAQNDEIFEGMRNIKANAMYIQK